jgi:hypothetical protein
MAVGCVAALLVVAGCLQGPLLLLLWVIYLSLAVTGDVFMGFQWDALLLESGLLVLFVAPWRLWTAWGERRAPAGVAVFLFHWLVFRLMFLSGLVKLAGGDVTWTSQSALLYHYFTQPLPNPLSWYAHQLPEWLQWVSCVMMFGVEILLPFAVFLGRRMRALAALGFIGLMVLVLLTGNYTFFNWLTLVLCLSLIDDPSWRWLRARLFLRWQLAEPVPADGAVDDAVADNAALGDAGVSAHRWGWLRRVPVGLFAVLSVPLTILAADGFLAGRIPGYGRQLPEALHGVYAGVQGLRSFNAYGLFQSMTTTRPEIIVEVSDDGIFWQPLEFHYKPGMLNRPASFVAPHQPRLDWQMWFAALSQGFHPQRDGHPSSPLFWFGSFMRGLLEHRSAVWALLPEPPIEREKIRHVRANLYLYEFTDWQQRQETGQIWTRRHQGLFAPAMSLPPSLR